MRVALVLLVLALAGTCVLGGGTKTTLPKPPKTSKPTKATKPGQTTKTPKPTSTLAAGQCAWCDYECYALNNAPDTCTVALIFIAIGGVLAIAILACCCACCCCTGRRHIKRKRAEMYRRAAEEDFDETPYDD